MTYVAKTLRYPIIFEGRFVYERVKVKVICVNNIQKGEVENEYLRSILLTAYKLYGSM